MTRAKEHAKSVLKKHGRSFHFASKLLAPEYRLRAARLYAFCRHIDDLADESTDPELATQQLEQIHTDIQKGQSTHIVVADMIALMRELSMPHAPALSLIKGVQSDLSMQGLKDEAALLRYAYQVAGTVGLMMCVLLDVRDKNAWPFAMDLGIAMQLTNIARDVGQDASKGRIYLPVTWIGNISTDDITHPDTAQAQTVQTATQRLLALAHVYYQSGLAGMLYLPPAARYGIIVAAAVYREIGQVVAKSDYRSWDRRAVVPQTRKIYCASQALVRYALQIRSRQSPPQHDPHLHRHLQNCFGAHDPAST